MMTFFSSTIKADDSSLRVVSVTAVSVHAPLQDIVEFNMPPLDEYWLTSVSLGWEPLRVPEWVSFGVEGQIVKHWEAADAWELNPVFVMRWHRLPWSKWAPSSFALGNGLSYATRVPGMEDKYFEVVSRPLYYILLEFTFGLPQLDAWDLVLRVHHRSGVFGLFGESLKAGSNALGVGVGYRFGGGGRATSF